MCTSLLLARTEQGQKRPKDRRVYAASNAKLNVVQGRRNIGGRRRWVAFGGFKTVQEGKRLSYVGKEKRIEFSRVGQGRKPESVREVDER